MLAITSALASALFLAVPATPLKITTQDDILKTSKQLASALFSFYPGNSTGEPIGILPWRLRRTGEGYDWWQSGAFMSAFVDYWTLTGDDTYNDAVTQGILAQIGSDEDFMPVNSTASIYNEHQCIWALGALTAAEYGFPDPPAEQPQWLELAQRVFDNQVGRWEMEEEDDDDGTCDGGLRAQLLFTSDAYRYKSSLATACFFSLGARLAKYTRNETYADWAEKAWDWLSDEVDFIDKDSWEVYAGANITDECDNVDDYTRSIDAAAVLQGAAFMYNYTSGDDDWKDRVDNLANSLIKNFFPKGVFTESRCPRTTLTEGCYAWSTFNGLVHRWLALTTQVAPFTREFILPVMRSSAEEAISAKCDGDECDWKSECCLSFQDIDWDQY
ncbi:hypothetical protein ACJZ2D_003032 [Fusarium nematophilum]